MDGIQILQITTDALSTLMKASFPAMIIGMSVGLVISLFQALTQIQEMTLTFVPKIIAIFISLLIFAEYIGSTMNVFFDKILQLLVEGNVF